MKRLVLAMVLGAVLGFATLANAYTWSVTQPFLWSFGKDELIQIGPLASPDVTPTSAVSLNDSGEVVGTFITEGKHSPTEYHAYIWSKVTGIKDLGVMLDGNASYGTSITQIERFLFIVSVTMPKFII